MQTNNKVLLMILDGWGIGNKGKSDAIFNANTPYIDYLDNTYPHSQLLTCGEKVGLPDGQMGNSEVGHLNIGAGRVVYQDLVRINLAIKDNSISENPTIVEALNYAKNNNKAVHFIGLVSDGGVHSSEQHLYKLCDICKDFGLDKVFIHALTDGRDTDPKSGLGFLRNLQDHLDHSVGKIATICGRYYMMDRDKRWERVKIAYDAIINGIGDKYSNPFKAVQDSYNNGFSDEFIKPIILVDEKIEPIATIKDDDVVICFNFRTDRLREIVYALSQKDVHEFNMHRMPLYMVTMTRYDDSFTNVHIIFDKDNVANTLGEIVSKHGLKQLRIAETEKYAHVTFFFSGGREKEFDGEERILIHSPKVATYDLQPEMNAFKVKDSLVAEIKKQRFDFICLNFANGDMVGHTGVYPAIIKAVEAIDQCVKEVVETAKENAYNVIIIADHGNADFTVNDDGSPNTAHSLNPVPCILVNSKYKSVSDGILADVAPTILTLMGIDKPQEMTGRSLIVE